MIKWSSCHRHQALTCAYTFQRMEKCLAVVFSQIGGDAWPKPMPLRCPWCQSGIHGSWGQTFGVPMGEALKIPSEEPEETTEVPGDSEAWRFQPKKNSCWQPLESLTVTPVRLFASWCRSSAIRYQSHLTLMACFSDGFFSGFCGLFGGLKDHNSLQGISIMETSVLGWDLRGFNVVWRFPML